MSFSFGVKGASKALALAAVAAKLDEVVASQPAHEADRAQITATVETYVGMLPEADAGQEVTVNVNGTVCLAQVSEGAPKFITSVGVGVSAWLSTRTAEG